MSEELKPCPFTGKPPLPGVFEADDIGGWVVSSGVCQVWGETKAEAIAAWNTRLAPKAAGQWTQGVTPDGRAYIQDEDFTYDARLYVDGDFPSEQARAHYVDRILAALKDRDVVLEEAAERAAFVAGYRAARMVPDAYDSTSAAEEAWEGYRLVSRNLKERV